jgi:DNA-binding response OmpR family regulator
MSRFVRALLYSRDIETGARLAEALAGDDYEVVWRTTPRTALAAMSPPPEVALLDLSVPGTPDALEALGLCRELRRACPESVVVLLGTGAEEADVVQGLEHGADDYVTDGCGSRAVVARVGARLRRSPPVEPLRWGDLELDVAGRRCRVRGSEVRLRAKEFALLERLARAPGSVVPRAALVADVWGTSWLWPARAVDIHLAAVRRRLSEAATSAALAGGRVRMPSVVAVRGIGYRFDPPEEDQTGVAYTTRLSS